MSCLARIACSAAILLALAQPAAAQLYESVGTRAKGMAGAFVAVADDATATWWNPAGLASGPYFSSVIEYGRTDDPSAERSRGAAVTVPSFGLSVYRLQLSQIRPPSSTAPPPSDRQDSGALSMFGATVGQSIGNAVVVASTFKIDHVEGDTHADLDVGVMVKATHVRAGAVMKNVAKPTLGSGADALALDRQVRVGLALMSGGSATAADIVFAADADLTVTTTPVGDERHAAAGLELWAPNHRIGVRGGAAVNTVGDARGSVSGGVSLAFRKGAYVDGQLTGGSDPARKGWGVDLRLTY